MIVTFEDGTQYHALSMPVVEVTLANPVTEQIHTTSYPLGQATTYPAPGDFRGVHAYTVGND